MLFSILPLTISDYDLVSQLWNCVGKTKRALIPVDDSREGIERPDSSWRIIL